MAAAVLWAATACLVDDEVVRKRGEGGAVQVAMEPRRCGDDGGREGGALGGGGIGGGG